MSKFKTKTLVITSFLIALQIVFVRLLPIGSGSVRISFGFFPIAVAGMIFGPLGAGGVAILADILGMILFARGETFFPLFTLTEFLYGVGFGLMLHKKDLSYPKLAIFVFLQYIFLNLIINSLWLYFYNILIVGRHEGYFVIFTSRLIASAINLPLQFVGIWILCKYLKKPLSKII